MECLWIHYAYVLQQVQYTHKHSWIYHSTLQIICMQSALHTVLSPERLEFSIHRNFTQLAYNVLKLILSIHYFPYQCHITILQYVVDCPNSFWPGNVRILINSWIVFSILFNNAGRDESHGCLLQINFFCLSARWSQENTCWYNPVSLHKFKL